MEDFVQMIYLFNSILCLSIAPFLNKGSSKRAMVIISAVFAAISFSV